MTAVKLIAMTKPEIQIDGLDLTPEELIVYIARVSSPQNQTKMLSAPKLLQYLINNKHWSPFEQVDLTFEVITSRAIAAQMIRHKSIFFQEFSQRYSEVTSFETYEARSQDYKNRQNSLDNLNDETKNWFKTVQQKAQDVCYSLYKESLEKGIAKECARFLLPMSSTTRLYMKGSIRSFIHYFEARCHESSQKEHRDLALEMKKIFNEKFPIIAEALILNVQNMQKETTSKGVS